MLNQMTPEELYETHKHIATETIYKMFGNPKSIARKFRVEVEDLFQYARTGLWKAAITYDPSKSKFKTFAINNIKWHVTEKLNVECNIIKMNHCRKYEENELYGIVSFELPIEEEDSKTYHELVPSDVDLENDTIGNIVSKGVWRLLNDREKEIIEFKINGLNNREIGDKFNLTRAMIGHIIRELRKKLSGMEAELI